MVRLNAIDADPIACHVAALSDHLDGPRRVKADMLRELRHGLADTAEAYEADGIPAPEAAHRAVIEFGRPAHIAEQMQVELAARQARFSLAYLAVQGPIMEVSSRILWSNSPLPNHEPPDAAMVLSRVEDVSAWVVGVVAALALLAFGFGARWIPFRSRLVKLVAYTMLGKLAFIAVTGPLLVSLFDPGAPQGVVMGVYNYAYIVVISAMLGCMVWLSWRCLRVARRVDKLSTV